MKPDYKPDIEYALIATLIKEPKTLKLLTLKKEYFFTAPCRLAFETLEEMLSGGEAINLVSFGARYADKKGKVSDISSLFTAEDYYSSAFAETYRMQLVEEYVKREAQKLYEENRQYPKDLIQKVKELELEFSEVRAKSLPEAFKEFSKTYQEKKRKQAEGCGVGLVTGFDKLDTNCALEGGNLAILAAKTSVGKTALALNMAINAAMFGQRVLFFSAEMALDELMTRVLAQLSGISSTRFKYANADHSMSVVQGDVEACGENLKLIESGRLTSEDISRISRQQGVVDMIVVDYIQYLKDAQKKNGTNNDRVGEITRNLKALAMETKSVVLALSQVNRATQGAPELHNLRDSGNIEQDADVVFILHREDREDVLAELVIAKNRNGALAKVALKFDRKLTKYHE